VMVLESVENKRCLPTLSFIKCKLKIRLTSHLDLVVKMFAQDHYLMNIFPFGDAIKEWYDRKHRYVVDHP
jgi:hypothetical protein